MFLGMALAMALTPPLVVHGSLRVAMVVFAVLAALAAACFAAVAQERASAAEPGHAPARQSVLGRDLLLLYALSFLGLGYFNGLTTWLEAIVAPNGIDAEGAGALGGVLVVAGMVGAGVLSALSDRAGRRKPFIVACAGMALVTTYPLCTTHDFRWAMTLAAALGFFFLPAYALLLEMCTELAGVAAAGRATGVLLLMGNAGAVVISVAMPLVKGDAPTYRPAVLFLLATLALVFALSTVARETFGARAGRTAS
jgi:cyanate permease